MNNQSLSQPPTGDREPGSARRRELLGQLGDQLAGRYGLSLVVVLGLGSFCAVQLGEAVRQARYGYHEVCFSILFCALAIVCGYLFGKVLNLTKFYGETSAIEVKLRDDLKELKTRILAVQGLDAAVAKLLGTSGMLCTKYYDYPEFIASAEEDLFHKRNDHCGSIFLFGSMVGFAFTLPSALAKHACENGTGFQALRILGVDLVVSRNSWSWYSVYLAASTLRAMVAGSCRTMKELVAKHGHQFTIEIAYSTHDLSLAAIDMASASITVLQSLSPEAFRATISPHSTRRLLGFRFDDTWDDHDVCSRYHDALEGHWKFLSEHRGVETWMLGGLPDRGAGLVITHPHWTMNRVDGSSLTLVNSDQYDVERSNPASITVPDTDVPAFLDALLQYIPQRNPEIANILEVIDPCQSEVYKRLQFKCSCMTP